MNARGKNPESVSIIVRIGILLLALTLASTMVLAIGGCKKNSRDSGSTVIGRSLSYPGSVPVPFVRVQLSGERDNRLLVTDSTGSYMMPKVPTGTYILTFARFGLALYSTSVAVDADGQTYVFDLPSLNSGYTDIPGNVSDFTGPIPGADVWIIYDAGGLAHAASDASGNFSFPDLPDGDVSIMALAEDYETELIEEQRIGFEGIYRLDLVMNPTTPIDGGTVHGLITSSRGEPFADAYIGLFTNDTLPDIYMVAVDETLTGSDGSYEMTDVPPGEYQAIVIKSGYQLFSHLLIIEDQNDYEVNVSMADENY